MKSIEKLYICMEVGARDQKSIVFLLKMKPFNNFYIDKAHRALDIFHSAVFLLYLVKKFVQIPEQFLCCKTVYMLQSMKIITPLL